MEITEREIAQTINNLRVAGKLMPEQYLMRGLHGEEARQEGFRQMEAVVKLFTSYFAPKHIGRERWAAAEQIALGLVGADYRVISPGLMVEALNQAEQQHLEEQRTQAARYKTTTDFEAAERATRAEDFRVLWAWTKLQLAQGRRFQYLPTNEQITEFIVRNKIPGEIWRKQTAVIKAFLSDQNRVNALGGEKELKLTINREQMKLSLQLLH